MLCRFKTHFEARQLTAENVEEMKAWASPYLRDTEKGLILVYYEDEASSMWHKVSVSDWIVRTTENHFMAHSDQSFQSLYEPVP